ncbi:hypothetical protein LQ327_01420 [Actinomycetospora endophytica]|uniref:Uncharacterized protein n=1 Tax=Actinomycetospora endophytica TaxID=2291215 RepID=A0ABS8P3A9_9PSEU|nr:hypothetical protein [Actinomycetospora endophytica]MCD2192050.1 hypothetical protein [Actinomycetospora endophytica]
MTTTSWAGSSSLEHVGYVYDSTTGFARGVLSQVRAVLGAGGQVSAVVDPGEAETLQDALGPGSAITFTPPAELEDSNSLFFDHLRDVARAPRGLVLAQYSVFGIPDGRLRRGEDDINRQLAHLPVTLICACSTTAASTRLATAHGVHPRLLVDGIVRDNAAYRPADAVVQAGSGTPILGLTFRGPADLHHIRGHVRAVVSAAGLDDAAVDAHVVAVHEAALIVANRLPDRPGAPEPCELDMWATDTAITAEIRAPRSAEIAASSPPPEGLEYVRLFCWHAASFDAAGTYGVRVLTRRSHPRP